MWWLAMICLQSAAIRLRLLVETVESDWHSRKFQITPPQDGTEWAATGLSPSCSPLGTGHSLTHQTDGLPGDLGAGVEVQGTH